MTFQEFRQEAPSGLFSEWIRSQSQAEWDAMINHDFTRKIAAGTLPETAFKRYLIFEHAFVETSVTVLGHTLAKAPDMASKTRLAHAVHELTTTQEKYFQDTFTALGIPDEEREDHHLPQVVESFQDLMVRVSLEDGYEESLGAMLAAEWMYLTWCTQAQEQEPHNDFYARWIAIHTEPAFSEGVVWMREQLDERGPELTRSRQAKIARVFRRVLSMEIPFHTAAL